MKQLGGPGKGKNKDMDTQSIIAITIAIVVPTTAVLYNNSRIGDLKDSLNKRMDLLEKHVDSKIDSTFEHIKLLLELHTAIHHKKEDS